MPIKTEPEPEAEGFEVEMEYPEALSNYYFISGLPVTIADGSLDPSRKYCGVRNVPRNVRTYLLSRESLIHAIHVDNLDKAERPNAKPSVVVVPTTTTGDNPLYDGFQVIDPEADILRMSAAGSETIICSYTAY